MTREEEEEEGLVHLSYLHHQPCPRRKEEEELDRVLLDNLEVLLVRAMTF